VWLSAVVIATALMTHVVAQSHPLQSPDPETTLAGGPSDTQMPSVVRLRIFSPKASIDVPCLTTAAAGLGHIDLDVDEIGIDAILSLSHRLRCIDPPE
jgi:hypothetical protein